ncbi:hypothetical protein SCHPADRAFT_897404 [Schizopora paradoxa]|uniref:Uncharacterized protein n=1 Tax=Schizopora paradoxa TaxID=27342 RepID=A0A0H2QXB7_9AGAM|nr:hypothetical protein SCHPADRAFT_897404 [Schizopora paradoxa]
MRKATKGYSYFTSMVVIPTLAPQLENAVKALEAADESSDAEDAGEHANPQRVQEDRMAGSPSSNRPDVTTRFTANSTSSSTTSSPPPLQVSQPFFMQANAVTVAPANASGHVNAPTTPNNNRVLHNPPSPDVISISDDGEQEGNTGNNNLHRSPSDATLSGNQGAASAAAKANRNNRGATAEAKSARTAKRKSLPMNDERAIAYIAQLHEKGELDLSDNGTKLHVRQSNNALAIGRKMRGYHLKTASLLAREALFFGGQKEDRKQIRNEQDELEDLVFEQKQLAVLAEVKLAKRSQKLVNMTRTKAGDAFLQDLEENDNSDNELDYNDIVETSSVAERFEELEPFHSLEDDDNDLVGMDAMVVDVIGQPSHSGAVNN